MQSMKKKTILFPFIFVGTLFFAFSFVSFSLASAPSCAYSAADANTLSGSASRTFNETYSACMGHLPFQCLSSLGPNSQIQGSSCGCKPGYIQNNTGQCSPQDVLQQQCFISKGNYAHLKPSDTTGNYSCECDEGTITFNKDILTNKVNFKSDICYPLSNSIQQACGDDNKNKTITGQGVCACKTGFVLYEDQCVTPTEKTAKETELETNQTQCLESRGPNSEYKNSWCGCKEGYQQYTGGKCQTATEACQSWYGTSSRSTTADSTTCACEQGYILSNKQCVPLTKPVSAATATITPPVTILPSPVPTVISKPLITTPIKKKPQPSTESEVKTPPLSEITASTTSPQQITERQTEAREIIRPVPPVPIVKQENVFQRAWRKFLSWF